jgi:hypothetical protein
MNDLSKSSSLPVDKKRNLDEVENGDDKGDNEKVENP